MQQLEGKVAVITGAASGIGLATARLFAVEGAHVVATDVAEQGLADLVRETGAVAVVGDVSRSEDVDRTIDTAIERFGRLDILCNVAAIRDRFLPVDEMPDEVWRGVLDVNLTGPFQACRRAIPLMLGNGKGSIVNVASTAGLFGSRGGAAYTVSKHGLIGLTRSIAATYGRDGLRCVAVCPAKLSHRRAPAGAAASCIRAVELVSTALRARSCAIRSPRRSLASCYSPPPTRRVASMATSSWPTWAGLRSK
jgi:NAD(P)-dependent dehydrogenase (short-subunit alcohol dehydrogenase family)